MFKKRANDHSETLKRICSDLTCLTLEELKIVLKEIEVLGIGLRESELAKEADTASEEI